MSSRSNGVVLTPSLSAGFSLDPSNPDKSAESPSGHLFSSFPGQKCNASKRGGLAVGIMRIQRRDDGEPARRVSTSSMISRSLPSAVELY